MDPKKTKTSGILFIIGGLLFMLTYFGSKNVAFFTIGCAFIAIGTAAVARSKKAENEDKNKP